MLAELAFLRGATLSDQGDQDGAREAINEALTYDPEYQGIKGFPQALIDLLDERRETLAEISPAFLYIWPGPTDEEVYVNGTLDDESHNEGVRLVAGRHLVQVRGIGGLRGLWVNVTGSEATVVMPGSGRSIWTEYAASPGGERGLRLLLADEFHGQQGDIHILHYRSRHRPEGLTIRSEGNELLRWSKTRADGTVRDAGATGKPILPQQAIPGGRLRLTVGGGWQFAEPFHYVLMAVDLQVRIAGPLIIAAFARPGYGGEFRAVVDVDEADPVVGPLFFVPVGGAMGVQGAGDVAPYVLLGGQIAYNLDGVSASEYMGGLVLQGGVDISPPESPFLARVQGEAGFIGKHFNARTWVGVGFRL